MDDNQLVWDSSITQQTLQDNAKTNGILESTGVAIQKPKADFYCRCKPGQKLEDFVVVEVAYYTDPKTQKETQDHFLNKTNEVFNDDFKGFEYKVGDKRYRFIV